MKTPTIEHLLPVRHDPNFGDELKRIREMLGIDREELRILADIKSHDAIRRYEEKEQIPSVKNWYKLSEQITRFIKTKDSLYRKNFLRSFTAQELVAELMDRGFKVIVEST